MRFELVITTEPSEQMEMFIILFGTATIILSAGMLITNYIIMQKVSSVANDLQGFPKKVRAIINNLIPGEDD